MIDKLRSEPALGGALLSLLGAVLGIYLKDPALVAALVAIAAVFVGVRQVVTPTVVATQDVTTAARGAAEQVARGLGPATVGTVGVLADTAQGVVEGAVNQAVGAVTST